MGNLLNSAKRFLGNKNTVTIIGIILGVLVLYMFYNWRVNQAITPVSVPYARVAIASRTTITEDMIGFVQVPQNMVSANRNLVTNPNMVIGMQVAYGTTIPMNSLFYEELLMTEAEMPDSAFENIPDGYTVFSLPVTLQTTYGNSIFPGNYIDLFVRAIDDTDKIIFGRLIASIEVLAVKDAQGNHVFETTAEDRIPAVLLFAVPDDMFLLLRKAQELTVANIDITPVPRNAAYSANPGETLVTSDYIRDFILARTTILPEQHHQMMN